MERHYDAFISYRHAPLDMKVAADIQSSLERFPIPKALQRSHGKKRIGPIFRDKEELPTTSSLSDVIQRALKNSDYLIVICSTNTVESIWVQREIEAFLQDHDRKHILTVLADGEPQEVIPDILCREEVEVQNADGTVHVETRGIEPLSCDYRKKRSMAKREELPRLAAAILGCPYDELRQRQRRRQIRRLVSGFSAALLLVTAIAAFAVNRAVVIARQAEQIEEEYRNTLINQSRYLAEKSGELLAHGDRIGAIQVALAALPASESDNSRPLVTEALYALNNAVYPYHMPQFDQFLPKCILKTDGRANYDYYDNTDTQLSPNETRLLAMDISGHVFVFDLEQDILIATLTPRDIASEDVGFTILSANFVTEDRIVLLLERGAVCWDLHTKQAVWTTMYEPAVTLEGSYFSMHGMLDEQHQALVATLYDHNQFALLRFDTVTGEIQTAILPTEQEYDEIGGYHRIALSPDGTKAAVGITDEGSSDSNCPAHLLLADLESGTYQLISTAYADVPAVTFLPNGQIALLTTDIFVSYSSGNALPYAIELYDAKEGSLVWSSPDEVTINLELEAISASDLPTSSLQFWHRELANGGTQDVLVAQLAGHVFILDLEGKMLRTENFSEDILNVAIYDNGRLLLPLQNGKLLMYLPGGNSYMEVGDLTRTLYAANFSSVHGEFFLVSAPSQDIVVMSNQLGNTECTTVDVPISRLSYYRYQDREYRAIHTTVETEEDSKNRMLLYTPLSDIPIAIIDGAKRQLVSIQFNDEGEDVCYYVDEENYTLCGWGLESNQKVFEYDANCSAADILGFHGEQILCLETHFASTLSTLRLIDLVKKTESRVILEGDKCEGRLSEDGKYAAIAALDSRKDTVHLYLVDVENWKWMDVPEELQALPFYRDSFSFYGIPSFSEDSTKLAIWTGEEIVILDLTTMAISQHVQIPCSYCGYSMFLNDHILLVYGDSGRLTSWDLNTQSVVMEDPYDDITTGEGVFLGSGYFQAGSDEYHLYTFDEDGSFARYLSVGRGFASISGTEVLVIYDENGYNPVSNSDTTLKIYPLYTLDDLVAMANEILDGRTLTEAERIQYFIDS